MFIQGLTSGVQGDGLVQEQGEGDQEGHELHHDVGDVQAKGRDAEKVKQCVHKGFQNEDRKFKKNFNVDLESCAILDTKFEFED